MIRNMKMVRLSATDQFHVQMFYNTRDKESSECSGCVGVSYPFATCVRSCVLIGHKNSRNNLEEWL